MASDVGLSNGPQSRFTDPSKPSSKKGKEPMEKDEREEWANKQDYVNMLGDDIFETFVRRRDEALRATAELQKMMMLTRHSVRYIDSHERSLANEFQRFLEFAGQQHKKESRRAKLLGLPSPSIPANMFVVRPVGSFTLLPPKKRILEELKECRTRSKMYLKMQMEHIQNIRMAQTTRSLKGTPPLQAINLLSAIRKKPMTPRHPTQFSAKFLQEEPPHYAVSLHQKRPATVLAKTQADLYRWMTDFFREHVSNESGDSASCITGSRMSLKDSQIRDEQVLDQLCSIASITPSYIAKSPWYILRKSISQPTSQRGLRFHHLHSPPTIKQPNREMKIDLELVAQLEARRMNMRKKFLQLRTSSLGKQKRRPQTATSSPKQASRKMFVEDAADTTLNSLLFLQEAGVEEINNVWYICLANRGIGNVISQELASYTSLRCLDLSGNHVSLMSLTSLTALRKLILLGNQQSELEIPKGSFQELELPWLETLNLHKNHIKCIPNQIAFQMRAFSRLETLDLGDNPINYHLNLITLEKMQKLKKVFLWDTPLSRTVTYNGLGKCSPRLVPILQAAMRAQRAGQNWYLVKTDKLVKDGWYSDKLMYAVHDNDPLVLYRDQIFEVFDQCFLQRMSCDKKFKAKLEKSRRVEEEIQKAMLHKATTNRKFYSGPTSVIAESPETKEAELFIVDLQKVSSTKRLPCKHSELEEEVRDNTKRQRKDTKNASNTRKKYSIDTPRKKLSDKFKYGA